MGDDDDGKFGDSMVFPPNKRQQTITVTNQNNEVVNLEMIPSANSEENHALSGQKSVSRWTDPGDLQDATTISMRDARPSGLMGDAYGGMFGVEHSQDKNIPTSDDDDIPYGVKDLTPQNSLIKPKKRKDTLRRQTTKEFKQNLHSHIFDVDALMDDVVNDMASKD